MQRLQFGIVQQSFRSCVPPSRGKSFLQCFFIHAFEIHRCRSLPSPCSIRRHKRFWMVFCEVVLLLRRQLHHAPAFLWIAERGEDLSGHAEIGMIHVSVFGGLREGEGDTAKIVGGQGRVSLENAYDSIIVFQRSKLGRGRGVRLRP